MALAATRCFDSLVSCSSVRCSSWGMAASAPTCICFVLTCRCLATARSLELKELEQSARQLGASLDPNAPSSHTRQGGATTPVCELWDAAHERRGRQLHHSGQRAADHQVGCPVLVVGGVLDEDPVPLEGHSDGRVVLGEAELDATAERAGRARAPLCAVLDEAEHARRDAIGGHVPQPDARRLLRRGGQLSGSASPPGRSSRVASSAASGGLPSAASATAGSGSRSSASSATPSTSSAKRRISSISR